jgi:hypothetical protein
VVLVGAAAAAVVLVGAGGGVAVDSPPQDARIGSTINSRARTTVFFFENI